MSTSPKRGLSTSSSGAGSPRRSQSNFHSSGSGTMSRSRSSTLTRKKDLSRDEGSALNDLHQKADKEYEDEKRKEAEARKYWEEKKKEDQEKFSDEENDLGVRGSSRSNYSANNEYSTSPLPRVKGKRKQKQQAGGDSNKSSLSNGLEAVKVWQEKFQEVEARYKESMVSNAHLYNEKTALVYQVEVLKDRLEDSVQDLIDLRAELQRETSQVYHLRHHGEARDTEMDSLKKQITYRDEFLERHGLHLPTGEEDEEQQTLQQEMDSEEKQRLLKQIESLKEEIASMKSGSLLGDQQPRDIVQVSTRMVSEYKTKLQISEAENSRLEGMTNRLKAQVTRYKNQVKELEEREDELMKEKRQQAKEIRSLQSESEDQKTEIDLLKRRIEQLRKRRDYGSES